MAVDAQYVFVATGTLSTPQVPRVPRLDVFGGKCFHTSRWDYGVTGGNPSDWHLGKLRGKVAGEDGRHRRDGCDGCLGGSRAGALSGAVIRLSAHAVERR